MIFDIPRQLIQELGQSLQGQLKNDISQSQLHSLLESALRKCNLVTREEFDAQKAVLLRTREKLERLENELEALASAAHNDDKPSVKPVVKPKAESGSKPE